MKGLLVLALTALALAACSGAHLPTTAPTSAARTPQLYSAPCQVDCNSPAPAPTPNWTPVFSPVPYPIPVLYFSSGGGTAVGYVYHNCATWPYPGGIVEHGCKDKNGVVQPPVYIPQWPVQNIPPPPMHPHCFWIGFGTGAGSWWAVTNVLEMLKAGQVIAGPAGRLIFAFGGGVIGAYHGC